MRINAQLIDATRYVVEGAMTIDVNEARELHDQNVRFIDISKNWQQEHIPGARGNTVRTISR